MLNGGADLKNEQRYPKGCWNPRTSSEKEVTEEEQHRAGRSLHPGTHTSPLPSGKTLSGSGSSLAPGAPALRWPQRPHWGFPALSEVCQPACVSCRQSRAPWGLRWCPSPGFARERCLPTFSYSPSSVAAPEEGSRRSWSRSADVSFHFALWLLCLGWASWTGHIEWGGLHHGWRSLCLRCRGCKVALGSWHSCRSMRRTRCWATTHLLSGSRCCWCSRSRLTLPKSLQRCCFEWSCCSWTRTKYQCTSNSAPHG